MEINWMIVTYIVVGYFAISGFSRGWWKEAVTTIVLALLIFFLQNPGWAGSFIDLVNGLIATVWSVIPGSITPTLSNGIEAAFAINTAGGAFQFDGATPGTWLTILAVVVGIAILFSRATLGSEPTLLGKMMGAFVGGINGFLVVNLVREYLDGRALPGQTQTVSTARITVVGGSSFGPPAPDVSIQAVELPDFTILDSIIPWVAIAIGLLFLFSVFRTRVGVASSPDGKKLTAKVPPFYKQPKAPQRVQSVPPVTPVRIVE